LFASTSFLLLTVNIFIEIFNSHLPKASDPFDLTLNSQAGNCKSDILLVTNNLVKIFACDFAAPVSYNRVYLVYEATRPITSQFKLLNRRHGSYLDFYYKTGKKDISISILLSSLCIANIMANK
jgi:hypothetical protein